MVIMINSYNAAVKPICGRTLRYGRAIAMAVLLIDRQGTTVVTNNGRATRRLSLYAVAPYAMAAPLR